MAKRKLGVALIGQGFMGRAHSNAFRQAPVFFDLPFAIERRVICGQDRERLLKMADTWGWQEIATDWRAVVERPDIDIVDVASPNFLHAPMAIAAAEAGKIVFCEKPLALTAEEGERMLQAARGVRTMVWFNYRRVPAIAFARQLIEEGRIGRVYHYRAKYMQEWGGGRPHNWKMERAQAGPGVIGDLLSHVVDMATWLNGPIAGLSAATRIFAPGRKVEDAVMALARFENGSVGTLDATRFGVGARNSNAFEIQGERGMLRYDLEDFNHLEFYDAGEARNMQGPRRILVTGPDQPYAGVFWKPGHVTGYEHTFIAALGDFLLALDRDAPFHPDFADAQAVQRVLAAVERSAGSGTWANPRDASARLDETTRGSAESEIV